MVSGTLFGATIGLGIQLFSNSVRLHLWQALARLLPAGCTCSDT